MTQNDKGITNEFISDILRHVKLILNIVDSSKDAILVFYINALCTNILIKTNRKIIIPDMKYTIINLVIDKYISDNNFINGMSEEASKSIQSMSEAGRSVTFGVSSSFTNTLDLLAKQQLDENENLIRKFKLLYKL